MCECLNFFSTERPRCWLRFWKTRPTDPPETGRPGAIVQRGCVETGGRPGRGNLRSTRSRRRSLKQVPLSTIFHCHLPYYSYVRAIDVCSACSYMFYFAGSNLTPTPRPTVRLIPPVVTPDTPPQPRLLRPLILQTSTPGQAVVRDPRTRRRPIRTHIRSSPPQERRPLVSVMQTTAWTRPATPRSYPTWWPRGPPPQPPLTLDFSNRPQVSYFHSESSLFCGNKIFCFCRNMQLV